MSLIMQSSLVIVLVLISMLNAEIGPSLLPEKSLVVDKPICLTVALCPIKCKRYINRNGCPSCECNPCVFGDPLVNVSCGEGKQECSVAGGVCKVNLLTDKSYCCPKEHEGCCPYTPDVITNDPDILFPCLPQCSSDGDCKEGQKCCGTCPSRCVNAVIS